MREQPKRARVVVVGAGPAGIFAALRLKELGYTGVTVLERDAEIAATTRSATVDGLAFDYSTKFVPNVTLGSPVGYPWQKELIDRHGLELVPSPDPVFFDPARRRVLDRPAFLVQHPKRRVLGEFVRGALLLHRAWNECGIPGVIGSGLTGPAETIDAWGRRHGVEVFGRWLAFMSDVFGAAPAHRQHAAYLVKSRLYFAGGYLQAGLARNTLRREVSKALVNRHSRAYPAGREAVRAFLDFPQARTINSVFRLGYRHFLRTIVEREQLQISCGQRIERLEPLVASGEGEGAGRCRVRMDDGSSIDADAILFTCPPVAIADITRAQPELRRLFSLPELDHTLHVWMFRATGWPTKEIGARGTMLEASNPVRLGTPDMLIDGSPYGVSKEWEESDVLVAPCYRPRDLSEVDAETALVVTMRRLGIDVTEVLGARSFHYPRAVPAEACGDGWFDEVARLQGRDGLYFLGEAFSGQTVPAVIDHTRRFVDEHFVPDADGAPSGGRRRFRRAAPEPAADQAPVAT